MVRLFWFICSQRSPATVRYEQFRDSGRVAEPSVFIERLCAGVRGKLSVCKYGAVLQQLVRLFHSLKDIC